MLARARQLADELVRLRRDIHQHPELGFQEFRTAALVADTLAEIGLEVRTGVGRTGVVGQIGTGDGPTIAIRADMDALPIQEQRGDKPYCSENEGVMHACGHDAHTAILLGVAHLLKQSFAGGQWQGNVRLLFQPSEETFGDEGFSGATAMIDDGALEGVDAVIALHVDSTHPAGEVRFQDGPSLAAVDSFEAWLYGSGGHGAYPHQGSDPIHMLGSILNGIYAIPSRRIDPLQNCVISIGQVSGGAAPNVIPGEVYMQGTIRSHSQETRERLWAELERVLSLSEWLGGRYKLTLYRGYPVLYNDPEVNDWLRQVTREVVGETAVIESQFGMGAEDFAYMAERAKGAMFMLGAALPDDLLRNHHTDIFDIDERVMPVGAAILAETAVRFVTGGL